MVPKAASDARRAAATGLAASTGPASSATGGSVATTSLARKAVADEYAALLKSVPQLAGLGEVFKTCEPVRWTHLRHLYIVINCSPLTKEGELLLERASWRLFHEHAMGLSHRSQATQVALHRQSGLKSQTHHPGSLQHQPFASMPLRVSHRATALHTITQGIMCECHSRLCPALSAYMHVCKHECQHMFSEPPSILDHRCRSG